MRLCSCQDWAEQCAGRTAGIFVETAFGNSTGQPWQKLDTGRSPQEPFQESVSDPQRDAETFAFPERYKTAPVTVALQEHNSERH